MSFLSNDNIILLLEVCQDLSVTKEELTSFAKIFYFNYDGSHNDIMAINKSFIMHMTYIKKQKTPEPKVSYLNEYDSKPPDPPLFLDKMDTSNIQIENLIADKLKEREMDLIQIQKSYNPDIDIESVKLIKISDVIADMNIFDELPNDSESSILSKPRVSIGNTTTYMYEEDSHIVYPLPQENENVVDNGVENGMNKKLNIILDRLIQIEEMLKSLLKT
jgi:hypothetical protein